MHKIHFDPVKHKYTYIGDDERYKDIHFLSCTTFLSKFKTEFNTMYWSYYKAIKDYCSSISEQNWINVKRRSGGWEYVVVYYFCNIDKVPYQVQSDINKRALEYVQDWSIKNQISTTKGSAIHNDLEVDFLIAKGFIKEEDYYEVLNSDPFYLTRNYSVDKQSYPECIIFNLEYGLSGMVDRVDRDSYWLDITDYKTSIEITKEAFMGQKMKVIDLPDANYYHYQMQMSIYGWMLEQYGYKVRSLNLEHLICKDRESKEIVDIVPYKMEYRPDLVERMLEYRYKTP